MAAKSNVGVLTVYMDAVTDNFHAGLDAASKKVSSFKGDMKGLTKVFSSMGGKLSKVAGSISGMFKAVELATELLKGNVSAAADLIKSLPFGIGQAMSMLEGSMAWMMGVSAEIDRIKAAIAEMEGTTAISVAMLDKHKAGMEEVAGSILSAADAALVLQAHLDSGAEASGELKQHLRGVREEEKRLAEIAKLEKRQRLIERKPIEAGGLRAQEHAQNAILLAQLRKQQVALQKLETLRKEILKQEKLSVAEAEKKAIADAKEAERLDLLKQAHEDLAAATKARAAIAARGLSGSSDTFTSPMGTISFPSLDETAALARLQLDELQAIDRSIQEATAKIGELGGVPNVAPTAPANVAPIAPANVAPPKEVSRWVAADRAPEREQKLAPKPPRMGAIKLPGLGSVAELGKKQLSQLEMIGTAVADVKTSIVELSRA